MLPGTNYVILAVLAFIAIIWTFSSMGMIKPRSRELHVEKEQYIETAIETLEKIYAYMEEMPYNHEKVRELLNRGQIYEALEAARTNHDVYHFFRNY